MFVSSRFYCLWTPILVAFSSNSQDLEDSMQECKMHVGWVSQMLKKIQDKLQLKAVVNRWNPHGWGPRLNGSLLLANQVLVVSYSFFCFNQCIFKSLKCFLTQDSHMLSSGCMCHMSITSVASTRVSNSSHRHVSPAPLSPAVNIEVQIG